MILDGIDSPADLKRLPREHLETLAGEIRRVLIDVCSRNGGHLAPNLGVVELTIALHRVFDAPRDAIVWDVSHQTYVHKLLTGRRDRIGTLRKEGGLSGFASREESPYDPFGAGHASTAISAALGLAIARDLRGGDESVVAVVGDGALTGGLAYEALNNAGRLHGNFVVVLNDNEMSIAPNVGAIASYLSVLRSKPFVENVRERTKEVLDRVPFGGAAKKAVQSAEFAAKRFVAPAEKQAVIFEELGFRYIGPVDGHDLTALMAAFENARRLARPVVVHVRTVKGKGFDPAERDARAFHGCGAFDVADGSFAPAGVPTFSDAFGEAVCTLAEHDERIIAITAAMPDGTKLSRFAARFPGRFFDVGIAEAHAVCFAAGAAAGGLRPICAIYSTFLQRAYDQIVHDVCVQNLPVVFCLDRAGLVGDDGPTHMGLYDIAYLRALPNMTIMAPASESDVLPMLRHALSLNAPVAIRYPRGASGARGAVTAQPVEHGRAAVVRRGRGVAVLALGNTVHVALAAWELLDPDLRPTVADARFARPLDTALLEELVSDHRIVVTLEEHSLPAGFGSAVLEAVSERDLPLRVVRVGVPPELVRHASQASQRARYGLEPERLAAQLGALARSVLVREGVP
jgi:1-deoxy-D-xylulose-5-phosphate synthase